MTNLSATTQTNVGDMMSGREQFLRPDVSAQDTAEALRLTPAAIEAQRV
jgi:plasmid maintenance system antidote protein VapI